ncbi:MAG TPA: hypothetical protein VMF91_10745 [Bryobacteraceae bacterium]|nr:hypothetical protein [Bryobacteraceae bacterium]
MSRVETRVHFGAQSSYLCFHMLLETLILPHIQENANENGKRRDADCEQNL